MNGAQHEFVTIRSQHDIFSLLGGKRGVDIVFFLPPQSLRFINGSQLSFVVRVVGECCHKDWSFCAALLMISPHRDAIWLMMMM